MTAFEDLTWQEAALPGNDNAPKPVQAAHALTAIPAMPGLDILTTATSDRGPIPRCHVDAQHQNAYLRL
jgi:hypothetical protein